MPKKIEPESYETTNYGDENELYNKYAVIKQIVADKVREKANVGCGVQFVGDFLKINYQTYEMNMHNRIREVQKTAHDTIKELVKHIKKEFKSRTGKVLDLKEVKEKSDYRIEKVSLNERYYFISWCLYDIK